MTLLFVQIGYSWICKPHTLPPTFVHFLNHHGGKELWFYKAARVCRCLALLWTQNAGSTLNPDILRGYLAFLKPSECCRSCLKGLGGGTAQALSTP